MSSSRYANYRARLNRYGTNQAERLNEGRQGNFEKFLANSPHRVEFPYGLEEELRMGVLEPSSQDETETVMHLLTRVQDSYEIGDVLEILDDKYMVWYLDERKNSGYNRWTLIKFNLTIDISNKIRMSNDEDYDEKNIPCYLWGQENNMLKNELRSRSRSATLYMENIKLDFIILPLRPDIKIDTYIRVIIKDKNDNNYKRYYRVTGFDIVSTPGIMYISMDNIPEKATGIPDGIEEKTEETFWFHGSTGDDNNG